ncbi:MAG TPA: ribonuclease P protein component [Planctomycetaceae bacterium]|jgi:ribonuclease P protein component|nr:ribonuclease P protein component [Planctomycetaceae bacterium]
MSSSPDVNAASFPKAARLRTSSEFKNVYDRRCKASDGTLLVFVNSNALGRTRLGLSVSRRFGPAIKRNRFKRLVREAFRLSQAELPIGVDLVVIPQGALRETMATYHESLLRLVRKLHRRLVASPSPLPSTDTVREDTAP